MKHERPRVDLGAEPAGLAADPAIQPGEGERHEPPALAAQQVVALGLARVRGEVAGLAIAEIEAMNQPVAAQKLEHLIDARPSDMSRSADLRLELPGADRLCALASARTTTGRVELR